MIDAILVVFLAGAFTTAVLTVLAWLIGLSEMT